MAATSARDMQPVFEWSRVLKAERMEFSMCGGSEEMEPLLLLLLFVVLMGPERGRGMAVDAEEVLRVLGDVKAWGVRFRGVVSADRDAGGGVDDA